MNDDVRKILLMLDEMLANLTQTKRRDWMKLCRRVWRDYIKPWRDGVQSAEWIAEVRAFIALFLLVTRMRAKGESMESISKKVQSSS